MNISTITKILAGLCLLGAAWIALLAAVMHLSAAPPAALVPFAGPGFIAALPAHVAITDDLPLGLVLISDDPGFVADLYRAGAHLVLPAGLMGCAPLER
ncbi:MAG: hypothetical protein ACSHWZ_15925 [Sulfitobacter sp.]